MKVNINRQLAGLEDLAFGEGTVEQLRQGETVTITKINLNNLPFNETLTAADVLTPIYEEVVPHMDEILLANDNAITASTKASEAAASAAAALLSEQAAAVSEGLIASHLVAEDNPHSVTKSQVGLGNVDNTSDADKPISTLQQEVLDLKANKTQLGGRHNYLINGNFDSWQYATSQTSSGYGSDDRWSNANNGSAKTHSRIACTDTETALFNATYFSRTVTTSVVGASNFINKQQAIENVTLLAGKTVTLSFWAKADSNKNIAMHLKQNFGTGGSPSAEINAIELQLIALTTTWQKKTITLTIPSTVGKTLGADGAHTSFTNVIFTLDAGSSTTAGILGQQSGTFDIAQVKLEDGAVATDVWHPYDGEFGGEIQACQRYLPVIQPLSYLAGLAGSTILAWIPIPLAVVPRVAPTGLYTSGAISGSIATNGGGAQIALTAVALNNASTTSCLLNCSVASGLTSGQCSLMYSGSNKFLFTGCEL